MIILYFIFSFSVFFSTFLAPFGSDVYLRRLAGDGLRLLRLRRRDGVDAFPEAVRLSNLEIYLKTLGREFFLVPML
jgi:hypothetical protein